MTNLRTVTSIRNTLLTRRIEKRSDKTYPFFTLTPMTHQNLFSIKGLTFLLSSYHVIILLT